MKILAAQEEKPQPGKPDRRFAKPSETAAIDHIAAFDGNRIFCYLTNHGDLVTANVGGSGFYWPSVPRTSRNQREEDLRGKTTADYSSGLWVSGIVKGSGES